jgi:hypothetical protein
MKYFSWANHCEFFYLVIFQYDSHIPANIFICKNWLGEWTAFFDVEYVAETSHVPNFKFNTLYFDVIDHFEEGRSILMNRDIDADLSFYSDIKICYITYVDVDKLCLKTKDLNHPDNLSVMSYACQLQQTFLQGVWYYIIVINFQGGSLFID